MTGGANDIVDVASGSLIQVQSWHDLLRAAGIESRVVGDNLTAGLGTALPGSVELWVHRADATAAGAAIGGAGGNLDSESESPSVPPQVRPMLDPTPDHPRGPQQKASLHRPPSSR
ncbi:DUF2007 domain-containing protein [Fimbriiglobus ruber]|uniref:DUF2007 domain-containing protein n=1 Tax=Fimbriiglobus ruber TaxID=1908690 RepID=UPI000B4BEDED|nr:DUF2007 domain-containing protein [Fimbriiglobus ruber]